MRAARLALMLALAGALASCALFQSDDKKAEAKAEEAAKTDEAPANPRDVPTVRLITAQTPAVRAWRKIAARHIYAKYPNRIYKGKIPPLVHAVVVVETDVDADGTVRNVTFSRVPSHAPDVPPKIAELIKAASPLPNPGKLGGHTYVDTWLWDTSEKFQIDSITLGQRSR
jgi:protein TonB